MAGVVLETLSWKKLIILGASLFLLLITFFLIGGLVAPNPSNVMTIMGTKCVNKLGRANQEWFIPRGGNEKCDQVDSLDESRVFDESISANQIVFAFWLPYNRNGQQFDFSRWHQMMIAVLQLDIYYDEDLEVEENAILQLDARIGYRSKEDGPNDWKELASSLEERQLSCIIDESQKQPGYTYDCDILPLFELGSLHHDFYLVNIRLPVDPHIGVNMGIGKIKDMTLVGIHQNGGFTKVWLCMKTVMFPMVLAVLIWFWRRINMLSRPPNLLEKTLFALGIAMSFLNLPVEWFSLAINIPFMLLLTDIRQGVFYGMLLSFWLIFTGEHLMDKTKRNKLVHYRTHLLAVGIGCFCLFLFEICERGMSLSNPFFSIWVSALGTKVALAFIIIAGIAASCYFVFLCYMIVKVFQNISAKKSTLPSMSKGRRTYYMGLMYRFKFLMLTTLVCAALTVIFFIMGQLSEGQWKWSDEAVSLEYTSAFFTGVYGMWNIYVFGLLSLYAPSHKLFAPSSSTNADSNEEEIQLTFMASSAVTDADALQSFITKTAED